MAIERLQGNDPHFVTTDIDYPHPPSHVCAAARSTLGSLDGLRTIDRALLSAMMTEIERSIPASSDRWIGFDARKFTGGELVLIRRLVEHGHLIKMIAPPMDDCGDVVVYFLSPGVVA